VKCNAPKVAPTVLPIKSLLAPPMPFQIDLIGLRIYRSGNRVETTSANWREQSDFRDATNGQSVGRGVPPQAFQGEAGG
jgi:hypothetical protein